MDVGIQYHGCWYLIQMDVGMDGGMTGTPAACNLHAQEASRHGYTNTINTEAGCYSCALYCYYYSICMLCTNC